MTESVSHSRDVSQLVTAFLLAVVLTFVFIAAVESIIHIGDRGDYGWHEVVDRSFARTKTTLDTDWWIVVADGREPISVECEPQLWLSAAPGSRVRLSRTTWRSPFGLVPKDPTFEVTEVESPADREVAP